MGRGKEGADLSHNRLCKWKGRAPASFAQMGTGGCSVKQMWPRLSRRKGSCHQLSFLPRKIDSVTSLQQKSNIFFKCKSFYKRHGAKPEVGHGKCCLFSPPTNALLPTSWTWVSGQVFLVIRITWELVRCGNSQPTAPHSAYPRPTKSESPGPGNL